MTERAASSPRGAGSVADALARVPAELKGRGALGVLAARGARRQDDEAAGVRGERAHGQEHRPGDLGDIRGGRGGRQPLALRRRGGSSSGPTAPSRGSTSTT